MEAAVHTGRLMCNEISVSTIDSYTPVFLVINVCIVCVCVIPSVLSASLWLAA